MKADLSLCHFNKQDGLDIVTLRC